MDKMSMRNWFREPDPSRRKDEASFRVKPGVGDKPAKPAKVEVKVDRRQLITGTCTLCAVAVLMVIGLLPARTADDGNTPSAQADTSASVTMTKDCVLIQRLMFAPCNHELTRREPLPSDLAGKTRADLERSYDLWRVTSYAPNEVRMEQQLDMYCPQHLVLMPDEGGLLCIWKNTYGDALSLVSELQIPLTDFTESQQALLRPGLGFDTESDLNAWLENAES